MPTFKRASPMPTPSIRIPAFGTMAQRHRHGLFRQNDILRHIFETVVERCLAEGFAVDASLIAADPDKQRSIPGAEWEAKEDADRSR
ncbi:MULTISPECIES: hypothetical protein [unclassified Rhizobium]|uniref:hypothetical protein n=1 Tax=unclassified Rhizobium TaxID=2613769 RepID=UPI0035A00571